MRGQRHVLCNVASQLLPSCFMPSSLLPDTDLQIEPSKAPCTSCVDYGYLTLNSHNCMLIEAGVCCNALHSHFKKLSLCLTSDTVKACSRRCGDFNIPDRPAAAHQMGCVIPSPCCFSSCCPPVMSLSTAEHRMCMLKLVLSLSMTLCCRSQLKGHKFDCTSWSARRGVPRLDF